MPTTATMLNARDLVDLAAIDARAGLANLTTWLETPVTRTA
jgi:hypothetical protein